MVMVHAEGYDAIRYMAKRLEEAGRTAAETSLRQELGQ